jgi:hypothetical protein
MAGLSISARIDASRSIGRRHSRPSSGKDRGFPRNEQVTQAKRSDACLTNHPEREAWKEIGGA